MKIIPIIVIFLSFGILACSDISDMVSEYRFAKAYVSASKLSLEIDMVTYYEVGSDSNLEAGPLSESTLLAIFQDSQKVKKYAKDPWGNPFYLVIIEGTIEPLDGELEGPLVSYLVMSTGPNGIYDRGLKDDISFGDGFPPQGSNITIIAPK